MPLESFTDDALIPWPAERSAGGHEVLASQAACPFQAFSIKRLHARELRRPSHGLSPQQRGVVLHDVLQLIWKEDAPGAPHLRSRASLISAATEGRLQGLVEHHTAAALSKYYKRAVSAWERAYLDAERERIVQLALEWLDFERGRVDFEVVHCEEKIAITVGDLHLSIRTDRIDEVSGKHLLLDYKTGLVSAAGWEGDRPEEPQLPLYAVFGGIENVAGALLAQVRSGDVGLSGCVENAETLLMPGIPKSHNLARNGYTTEVRDEWQRVLLELGRSFVAGEAFVDPKRHPQTCKYCGLNGLCRVSETAVALHPASEDDAEASDEATHE